MQLQWWIDEPSTGESRRIIWKNINELLNSGHKYNMILATHCNTFNGRGWSVMWYVSCIKAGNFVIISNPEEFKIQYSAGYKLNIKFDDFLINNNNLGSYLNDDTYKNSAGLIDGISLYSNYFMVNPRFEP